MNSRVNTLKIEVGRLKEKIISENKKRIACLKKVESIKSYLTKTKKISISTYKTKCNEIERENKKILDINKKINQYEKQISQKEILILKYEKSISNKNEKQISDITSDLSEQKERSLKMAKDIETLKGPENIIKILFLASNPSDTDALRLDQEARDIEEKIKLSKYKDNIKFISKWAVRVSDVLQAINEEQPNIIHFSGHGSVCGEIALENLIGKMKLITPEAFSSAIATRSDCVKIVLFNACYSEIQAIEIVKHIDISIGMSNSISDEAAKVFAVQFYSSIGFGLPIKQAFDQAIAELKMEGIKEENTPKMHVSEGIDVEQYKLINI